LRNFSELVLFKKAGRILKMHSWDLSKYRQGKKMANRHKKMDAEDASLQY